MPFDPTSADSALPREAAGPWSEAEAESGANLFCLAMLAGSVGLMGLCWWTGWTLAFLLMQIVVISIVIWQACDPFAEAAQWIGKTLKLPGSVRGATLDAVASSLPELFIGIFFVLLAVLEASGSGGAMRVAGGGYGSTVATCVGSAVYNMMLIPAVCAIVISLSRQDRPAIVVQSEVLSRDGMWFLGCEMLLIFFLAQRTLHWWMGAVLALLYVVYVAQLCRHARAHRLAHAAIHRHLDDADEEASTRLIVDELRAEGVKASTELVDRIRHERADEHDVPEQAQMLFNLVRVPLTHVTAWTLIVVSTLLTAAACYWLVEATRSTADHLDVPVFFVAVILAAAASSVPDTFLSIGASRRGDDDGAVSNVFGSNTFNICICLSFPLLFNSWLNGWEPVYLTQDGTASGAPLSGLVGMGVLLCVLTVVTLLIMWHRHQLTRGKAYVLCGMYGIFIAYAVLGSLGVEL